MKKILFSFFILFFVFSCSDDNDPDPQNQNPTNPNPNPIVGIGVNGGTVTSDDGKVKIIIPSGALTVGKQISIEKSTTTSPINDDDGTALGDVYEFLPSGLKFEKSVEVIINYSGFASEINDKTVLAAHWRTATDYEYLNIEKLGSDRVSFKVRSFSFVQLAQFREEFTGIPDKNFEQALIDLEIDTDKKINRRVLNTDIENIIHLIIDKLQIDNLIGIQGFTNLEILSAKENNIDEIDVIKSTKLWALILSKNQFSSIDISRYKNLTHFSIWRNNISTIDVSQNLALEFIDVAENVLTQLDLSKNINLEAVYCNYNLLTRINIKNGHNSLIETINPINPAFRANSNNPNLCIQVDNETDAINGVTPYDTWKKDDTAIYSEDCDN